ncbi:MAG: N-formylglutamate amidohydrolase, partial [Gammaproteobacteria bacterium]|nr:N-formylglutamate amidohydrolase [Gammaproteobacteria bacterium]
PWEIGILWDKDRPTAEALIRGFSDAGYQVGDNLPYSGKAPQDYTIDNHAEAAGLLHAGIEIRQDLIDGAEGVDKLVSVMRPIIKSLASSVRPGDAQEERRSAGHD